MKRALALALCLLLMPMALAETWVVSYFSAEDYDSTELLIRDDGTVLIPPYTYSVLRTLTPNGTPEAQKRYSAMKPIQTDHAYTDEELWDLDSRDYVRVALLDADGRPLTGFDYYWFDWIEDVVVFATPEGFCGAMDANGHILVEPDYFDIVPNGEGGWLALGRDGDTEIRYDHYYPLLYIDPRGGVHETGFHVQYSGLNRVKDGLCPLRWVKEYDERCIFVDAEGAWAFEGAYDYIGDTLNGLSIVSPDGDGMMLIDDAGNDLTGIYESIEYQEVPGDVAFFAYRDDAFAIFDGHTGEVRRSNSYPGEAAVYAWTCGTGVIAVECDSETEFYAMSGALLFAQDSDNGIRAWYSRADSFPQRLAVSTGEWPYTTAHIVDLRGRVLCDDYPDLSPALWQDGQARFITENYEINDSGPFGQADIDWTTFRYGVCDGDGAEILPCRYQSLSVLSLDRYWVQQDTRCGLVDGEGRWLYAINDYQFLMD